MGNSRSSCLTRLKAGPIGALSRAEMFFWSRSVSRTKTPPSFRLMIRAESSRRVQRGFRAMISSQERMFSMWAGLTRICQSDIGAGELRMLEPEGDQLLDKGVRQRVMVQFEDLSGHGGNAIQDGAAVLITGSALFQELEYVSNKIVQGLRRLFPEHQGQTAVDLDQGAAVDIGQGRDIDDMEEEIQFDQIFPAGIEAGPFQFVGHQQIAFDNLGVIGPVQVRFRSRTGLRTGPGRQRFQLLQQGGHRPMRQGLDKAS